MTYTFTPAELRQLLEQALSDYRACESVYDFSPDALINTVERTLTAVMIEQSQAALDKQQEFEEDTKRLENSLPYLDEDEPSIHPDDIPFIMQDLIPFDGLAYESDDNISETEVGLLPKW